MAHSETTGPCGLSILQIIDLAAGLRRGAVSCGLVDADILDLACTKIGRTLTDDLRLEQQDAKIPSYEERLVLLASRAFEAYCEPAHREACSAIGWSEGPEMKPMHAVRCLQAVFGSFTALQTVLRASKSDMLDLLVWVQAALEAEMQSRSLADQIMHWARIGRAIKKFGSFDYSRIPRVLAGELETAGLTAEEKAVWSERFLELMAEPGPGKEGISAELRKSSGAFGVDAFGNISRADTQTEG